MDAVLQTCEKEFEDCLKKLEKNQLSLQNALAAIKEARTDLRLTNVDLSEEDLIARLVRAAFSREQNSDVVAEAVNQNDAYEDDTVNDGENPDDPLSDNDVSIVAVAIIENTAEVEFQAGGGGLDVGESAIVFDDGDKPEAVAADATPIAVDATPIAVDATPIAVDATPIAVDAAPSSIDTAPIDADAASVTDIGNSNAIAQEDQEEGDEAASSAIDEDEGAAAANQATSTANDEDTVIENETKQEIGIGSVRDVAVTSSLSKVDGSFYCCPTVNKDKASTLRRLSGDIEKRTEDDMTLWVCDLKEEGQMYSLFSKQRGLTLRCVVEKVYSEVKCQIRLVDFGTIDTIPSAMLNKLPKELFNDPPHYALRCSLFPSVPAVPFEANWCFKDHTDNAVLKMTVTDIKRHDGAPIFIVDLATLPPRLISINAEVREHLFRKIDPNDQPIQMKSEYRVAPPEDEPPADEQNEEAEIKIDSPLIFSAGSGTMLSWAEQCESSSDDVDHGGDGKCSQLLSDEKIYSEDAGSDVAGAKASSLLNVRGEEKEPSMTVVLSEGSDAAQLSSEEKLHDQEHAELSRSSSNSSNRGGDVRHGILSALAWSEEQLERIQLSAFNQMDSRYFLVFASHAKVSESISSSQLILSPDCAAKLRKVQSSPESPSLFVLVILKDKKKLCFCGLGRVVKGVHQFNNVKRRDGSFVGLSCVTVEYVCSATLKSHWREQYNDGDELPYGEARRIMEKVTFEIRSGRALETVKVRAPPRAERRPERLSETRQHQPVHTTPVAILKRGDTSWEATQICKLSTNILYSEATCFVQVKACEKRLRHGLLSGTYTIDMESERHYEKLLESYPRGAVVIGLFCLADLGSRLGAVGRLNTRLKSITTRKWEHRKSMTVSYISSAMMSTGGMRVHVDGAEISAKAAQHSIKLLIEEIRKGTAKDFKDMPPDTLAAMRKPAWTVPPRSSSSASSHSENAAGPADDCHDDDDWDWDSNVQDTQPQVNAVEQIVVQPPEVSTDEQLCPTAAVTGPVATSDHEREVSSLSKADNGGSHDALKNTATVVQKPSAQLEFKKPGWSLASARRFRHSKGAMTCGVAHRPDNVITGQVDNAVSHGKLKNGTAQEDQFVQTNCKNPVWSLLSAVSDEDIVSTNTDYLGF